MRIKECENRDEWEAERRNHIGASEVAAILGVSPYGDALTVYEAKVTGHSIEDNKVMAYGRAVEDAIGQMYAHETGRPVENRGAYTIHYHPDIPFLGSTFDRVTEGCDDCPAPDGVTGPGALELKSVGGVGVYPKTWAEDPPIYYLVQNQVQMACGEFLWGDLAGLFPGYQLARGDRLRDDTFLETIYPALENFWRCVQDRTPPEPTSARGLEAAKRLWPSDDIETVILAAEFVELANQWEAQKASAKEANERKAVLEAKLRAAIGDATFGALPDGTILSLKTTTRKGYTRVVEASTYRTLRRSVPKGR